MIKQLIKIANELDQRKLWGEADQLDLIINKISEDTSGSEDFDDLNEEEWLPEKTNDALFEMIIEDEGETIEFVTKEILGYTDPYGHIRPMLIMKTSKGPKAFYKSSGTGTPGRVKSGQWVPFNGIAEFRGRPWFVKEPGAKIPSGELESISWDLKYIEEDMGTFVPTISVGKEMEDQHDEWGNRLLPEEELAPMEEVNKWLQRHGALNRGVFGLAIGEFKHSPLANTVGNYANFYGTETPSEGGFDAWYKSAEE